MEQALNANAMMAQMFGQQEKGISLNARAKATEAQIEEKAQEFEAVFLNQMLQHMFEGVETDDLFGGGHGEDVYRSLMMDEYAKMISKTGGIGVADHVKAELMRYQEMGQPSPVMPSKAASYQ